MLDRENLLEKLNAGPQVWNRFVAQFRLQAPAGSRIDLSNAVLPTTLEGFDFFNVNLHCAKLPRRMVRCDFGGNSLSANDLAGKTLICCRVSPVIQQFYSGTATFKGCVTTADFPEQDDPWQASAKPEPYIGVRPIPDKPQAHPLYNRR